MVHALFFFLGTDFICLILRSAWWSGRSEVSLADALHSYKPSEVATAIENRGIWALIGLVGR